MKKNKIVVVKKHFQKIKVIEHELRSGRPRLVKKRLCDIASIGHKVNITFKRMGIHKVATSVIDLTLMFGNVSVDKKEIEKIVDVGYVPYTDGKEFNI